jgi:hypothetical protein
MGPASMASSQPPGVVTDVLITQMRLDTGTCKQLVLLIESSYLSYLSTPLELVERVPDWPHALVPADAVRVAPWPEDVSGKPARS